MQSYRIDERLEPVTPESYRGLDYQFVVVMNEEEWKKRSADFDMGIELEIHAQNVVSTRAEVNYDSITGAFRILNRAAIAETPKTFAFSLDEKGIIFIDNEGLAGEIVRKIAQTRKLVNPCLERFLYDFLEQIIYADAEYLGAYDRRLDAIEKEIFAGQTEQQLKAITEIRNDLRDLNLHYEELIDVCQELEENENRFFRAENERYFHLVNQRIQRLDERVASLAGFTVQLRDLCQTKTDEKQNKNLAFLTVISSIFMPLTLIVGWYGMNFRYMPELDSRWGYPITIVVSVVIVVVSLLFFKKKKWL
ncbi:MAG: magnesium transporter CorA [Saccharofermentans sp.]|nr:magnesium transporter CorA [Saccharofermentans sp.]